MNSTRKPSVTNEQHSSQKNSEHKTNTTVQGIFFIISVHRINVVVANPTHEFHALLPLPQLLILESSLHLVYILLRLDAGQDTPGEHMLAHRVREMVVLELLYCKLEAPAKYIVHFGNQRAKNLQLLQCDHRIDCGLLHQYTEKRREPARSCCHSRELGKHRARLLGSARGTRSRRGGNGKRTCSTWKRECAE